MVASLVSVKVMSGFLLFTNQICNPDNTYPSPYRCDRQLAYSLGPQAVDAQADALGPVRQSDLENVFKL